jgi:hypothetical protein
MVVDSVRAPEVPLIVTVAAPVVAVLPAFSVSTADPVVVGLGLKLAVTPLGRPLAARVTPPVNPFAGVTVMVSVLLLPWVTDRVPAPGASAKLGATVTVRSTVVDAVRAPEVPLIVTVTGPPAVAVLLAVSVSTLEPVVRLVAKAAVTPLGRPEVASATLPVNPLAPVTVIVLVPLPPWATVTLAGEGESVKLGGGVTVRATVVDAVRLPEVPVMVTVTGPPIVAVLLAVSVNT